MIRPIVHRFPLLVRASARYVLVQRGSVILILLIALIFTIGFTHWFATQFPANSHLSLPVGAALGVLLFLGANAVQKRINQRIDRAFFRSAYDASQILQRLVADAQRATSRQQLAELLHEQLRQALHPRFLCIYLRESASGSLHLFHGDAPPGLGLLSLNIPVFDRLRRNPEVLDLSGNPEHFKAKVLGPIAALHPECLVPMIGRDSEIFGLIVLGARLSEESYSSEDKRLLVSVASQSATTLTNIHLAEQIAERLEAERRTEHEMEIARQVQKKLLPQRAPTLTTLEYAGHCNQARAVGGDYYDFLPLSPQRLLFVLADIAGKGISAALLMSNLQAILRSNCRIGFDNWSVLLPSVNESFYETTESCRYATLFVAEYDDVNRRLSYTNCGHNPPILLRGDQVSRLEATATVLGLFESWECSAADVQLEPGDILVMYTDGITEAIDDQGREFGDGRLIELVKAHRDLAPHLLLESILTEVRTFSRGAEQQDDMTIIVARGRAE
jgi:sigma-B regulation protein RsbU (phosphoserine phosphatase)